MAGQEIHRGRNAAVFRIIQISRTGNAGNRRSGHPLVSFEEAAHIVPVPPVPLRPAPVRRETSHLIQTARIPGLGNQLHLPKHRVAGDFLQDRRVRHRCSVLIPRQNRREIKPETVHAVGSHPIPQTVNDKLAHGGMIAVDRVPASAEIIVVSVRRQNVIDVIVDSLKREDRSVLVSLGGMVKHHIENDLDSVLFQFADQIFELLSLMVVLNHGRIAGVRRKEANGIIPPVIVKALPVNDTVAFHLVKLKNRHQLHSRHAQILQIRNLFPDSGKSSSRLHAG